MTDHLTDWKAKRRIEELEAEIERLKTALDNERARGIHSCGPHCQKLECRQRREIERLQAENEKWIRSLHSTIN